MAYWCRIYSERKKRVSPRLTPTADSDPPCPVYLQTKEIRTRSHATMPDTDNTDVTPSVCEYVCVCALSAVMEAEEERCYVVQLGRPEVVGCQSDVIIVTKR